MCMTSPDPYVWHAASMYVTRLIHLCDMTYSFVGNDTMICFTWLIHSCATNHSYFSSTRPYMWLCLIRLCIMTPSYVWHDFCIRVTWLTVIQFESACAAGYALHQVYLFACIWERGCVCVCVLAYLCAHVCVQVCICIYVRAWYVWVCMFLCVCTCAWVCVSVNMRVSLCTCVCTWV